MSANYFCLRVGYLSFVIIVFIVFISNISIFAAAAGDLDITFGNNGKIVTPLGQISSDRALTSALQSDGKIVVGGITINGSDTKIVVTRIHPDGTLDLSFGLNGITAKDMRNYSSSPSNARGNIITALTIQSDGKILIAGNQNIFGGTIVSTDLFFARINSDGTFDNSFGQDGIIYFSDGSKVRSMVIQNDGKIVAALDATIIFSALRLNSNGTIDTSFGNENTGVLKIAEFNGSRGFGITSQADGKLVLVGRDNNGFILARLNADGSFDTTFDNDGKVFTTIPNFSVTAYSVSVQADGKIVAVGDSITGGIEMAGNVAVVVRYNSDGTLDNTFDGDGIFTNAIGTGINRIYSSQIQTDGKILIGGETSDSSGIFNFTVVRLNSDGSFDNTFDSDGIIRLPVGTTNAFCQTVLFQPNGNIILTGYATFNDNLDIVLTRITSSGVLDSTFDEDGIANIELKNSDDDIHKIVIQPDGKIVAGLQIWTGIRNKFVIKRYNADGSSDNTFGNNGTVTTILSNGSYFQNDLTIQSDGKIVVIGGKSSSSSQGFIAVRYNADGSLDTSFGNSGIASTNNSWGSVITLQNDGKILIGGNSENANFDQDFCIIRLNSDGSLDKSFGNNGRVDTSIGNSFDYVRDIKLQSDGKIVAVGEVYFSFDLDVFPLDFGIVRYNPDGSLDSTFDTDGITTVDINNSEDGATLTEIQNDGKILVGGYSDTSPIDGYRNFGLVKLNTDGSLDTSFDGDGKVSTQTGDDSEINALKLLADGKIIVAGYSLSSIDNYDLLSIRYNSNGSLDSTYGTGGKSIIDINGNDDAITTIAFQTDGKMLAAGYASNQLNRDTLLARFIVNAPNNVPFDFDGDGKSDISVYRPKEGNWYLLNSTNGFSVANWGLSSDKIVPSDFDGDGKTDLAIYRPTEGNWYILRSSDIQPQIINFGLNDDIPYAADFDGDGRSEIINYRPSNGVWYILNLQNNQGNNILGSPTN